MYGEFNKLINYNSEVYMHLTFCMHGHFHLIHNPFEYKCETCQFFMHPFQDAIHT